MTITTIRKSDTELQVEQTLYVFARKEEAEAFQQCLVNGTVEGCYRAHPPVSMRPARADERADYLGPAEVAERRADENCPGDRPEEREGLTVDPA